MKGQAHQVGVFESRPAHTHTHTHTHTPDRAVAIQREVLWVVVPVSLLLGVECLDLMLEEALWWMKKRKKRGLAQLEAGSRAHSPTT
jgi:hypothetical protein